METLSPTIPVSPPPHGPFSAMRRMMPPTEVIRFLIVGVWNTAFAYVLFAGFVTLYKYLLPAHWIIWTASLASASSKPLSITMAFLCYKHFVFHTKGNYIKEWLRCLMVYGVGMFPELLILPLITKFFLLFQPTHHWAPYLAGIVMAVFTAMYSYFAHKKFSFKQ